MKTVILIDCLPIFGKITEWGLSTPTHLLLLGSSLRKNSIPTEIFEIDRKRYPKILAELPKYYQHLLNKFEKFSDGNTKYFGLACYGDTAYLNTIITSYAIKQAIPDAVIFVGGKGTIQSEDFAFKNSPIDFVVTGEADFILPEMILNLEKSGFHRKSMPEIVKCPDISNMNEIALIDWSLLDTVNQKGMRIVYLYGSRGCPFSCSFCANYSKRWRPFTIDRTMQELENAHNYFPKRKIISFQFADPVFGLNSKYKENFLKRLVSTAKNWNRRQFSFEDRVDTISEKHIEIFSALDGAVALGLESGSKRVLKLMNKTPNPTKFLARMEQVKGYFEKHKVYWAPYLMFGYIGETREDMIESRRYIEKLFSDTHYGFLILNKYQNFSGAPLTLPKENMEFFDWKKYAFSGWLSGLMEFSPGMDLIEMYKFCDPWVVDLGKKLSRNFKYSKGKMISYLYGRKMIKNSQHWKNAAVNSQKVVDRLHINPPVKLPVNEGIFPYLSAT
ncbi:MAG: B12-binding domain-containing radical SAM protein [Promethearchaeota archaeon]